MTTTTSLSIIGVIIAATIGSLIGALILYALGRQLTVTRLERLLGHRLFKLLGFHQDDAKKAVDWFNKHGAGGILYGRCIPVIRSLISIPAGIANFIREILPSHYDRKRNLEYTACRSRRLGRPIVE